MSTSAFPLSVWARAGQHLQQWLPGLLLCGAIAAASLWAATLPALAERGLSALTLAIVLGLVLGNTVYPRLAASCASGIACPRRGCCAPASSCTACA
jgi:uncharacterized membrane protein YadS